MTEEGQQIMDYAAQRFAPQTTTEIPTTEIVDEKPVETVEQTETTPTTEIVEAPNQEAHIETPTIEPVDYSKFLSETSEGLFTDVDSFKASLPKIKEYDQLVSAKTELEEKLKVDPFANDYVKTLDSMIRSGKSADEIENFTKISRLDLDQISAIDAKVMVMVKNGYSEAIARQIVEDEFPLELYEEGTRERMILEEKLRVSSLEDRNILKEYKKDLTTIDTSAQTQAENERLTAIATAEAHKQTVKQQIPKIAEALTGLGEINLNGKEGDEAVNLKFDFKDDFKAGLPKALESFFLDGQMEVNEDNIKLAQGYIAADYLQKNFGQISQAIFKHAEAITTEKMVNKYENRTGLPVETPNPVVDNSKKEYHDFLTKVAQGK